MSVVLSCYIVIFFGFAKVQKMLYYPKYMAQKNSLQDSNLAE